MLKRGILVALLTAALPATGCQASTSGVAAGSSKPMTLQQAVADAHRSAANKARDRYRHPAQTLAFFGVKPTDMVVEIYPGGGWYTEILRPYLRAEGSIALVGPEGQMARFRNAASADPAAYEGVLFSPIDSWDDGTTFPANSADVVLTFRNAHNWYMRGQGDQAFKAFYRMLKPGGTLGVVEHRLPESRPDADMKTSGYLKQSTVVAMAEAAGFKLVGTSEINANPKDNADHPEGVWTLPPSLRLGEKDRAQYLAIGESDRMTLKFMKPE